MASKLGVNDHQQPNRGSSIYPDVSTGDLGDLNLHFDFDFDFDLDLDTEKGLRGTSMSTPASEIPTSGSETELRTTKGSFSARSEKSQGERYVVFWEGPYDPANPQNWPNWRKWTAVMIVSGICFVT